MASRSKPFYGLLCTVPALIEPASEASPNGVYSQQNVRVIKFESDLHTMSASFIRELQYASLDHAAFLKYLAQALIGACSGELYVETDEDDPERPRVIAQPDCRVHGRARFIFQPTACSLEVCDHALSPVYYRDMDPKSLAQSSSSGSLSGTQRKETRSYSALTQKLLDVRDQIKCQITGRSCLHTETAHLLPFRRPSDISRKVFEQRLIRHRYEVDLPAHNSADWANESESEEVFGEAQTPGFTDQISNLLTLEHRTHAKWNAGQIWLVPAPTIFFDADLRPQPAAGPADPIPSWCSVRVIELSLYEKGRKGNSVHKKEVGHLRGPTQGYEVYWPDEPYFTCGQAEKLCSRSNSDSSLPYNRLAADMARRFATDEFRKWSKDTRKFDDDESVVGVNSSSRERKRSGGLSSDGINDEHMRAWAIDVARSSDSGPSAEDRD